MVKVERVIATGNQIIDDLLTTNKWAPEAIGYHFATASSAYGGGYGRGEASSGFRAFSAQQQLSAKDAFAAWSSVANIKFVQVGAAEAEIMLGTSLMPKTAWAYAPSEASFGGDVWIGSASFNNNPAQGNYAFMTIMHEIGHALGLGHPHDAKLTGGAGSALGEAEDALCPCCAGALHGQVNDLGKAATIAASAVRALDAMPYSIMSYRSFEGAVIAQGYQNEAFGYAQSPMARDIAAIQHLYGANYDTNAGHTVYSWSEKSGEKFINGVGQGAPGANKVFETVWDGNGTDTFDLSNFGSGVSVNLNPGGWTDFGTSQIARLAAGKEAPGNVATAYLHLGDTRSLIENAIAGAGNDILLGNTADNVLMGGAGNDEIYGGSGQNILVGGYLGNELSLVGKTTAGLSAVRLEQLSSDGNDLLVGGDANDIFVPGSGENEVHGQGGSDTLVLNFAFSDIVVAENADDSLTITYKNGSVQAFDIEYLGLTDGIFSFGTPKIVDVNPMADDVALLYSAGLGRDIDVSGLEFWLGRLADGSNLVEMASSVILSDEFAARFGAPDTLSDVDFVDVLYENVLGRDGEAAGVDYWSGALNSGTSRAEVLLAFANGAENVAAASQSNADRLELVAVSDAQWAMLAAA